MKNYEWIGRKFHSRCIGVGADDWNAENYSNEFQRGELVMSTKEVEALKNLKELLHEYPDERFTPHVMRESLEILVKMVEECAKK